MGGIHPFLAKLQEIGLLPMLIQKLQGQGGAAPPPGPPSGGAPGASGAQPPPANPPVPGMGGPNLQQHPDGGGGGASPQGEPKVKYDSSGAGASMPPPVAQPHEAVQSIAGLLMNYNNRKKKGQEAEAANIAQNLIQAIRSNDKDTINDILNDDHSKKILDKVYKGWLTKMQESQKPGKEPDPTVSGFESGIHKATAGGGAAPPQGQPPRGQPPGAPGGVRLPQPTQQDQLGAARTSAEVQASQQDPSRLLAGSATEKDLAAQEKAKAEIAKSVAEVKKAQLDVTKYETELKIKEQEAASSKQRGAIAVEREHQRYLKSLVDLDIAKARFRNAAQAHIGKQKQLPVSDRVKIESVDKAISIVNDVLAQKRGFSMSDITSLSNELKSAGSTELVKRLPGEYTTWLHGKGTVDDFAKALKDYKEGLKKAFDDGYPGWDGSKVPDKAAAGEDKPGAVPEGDDESVNVDADIVINPEDMEDKPSKPPN